MQSSIPFKHAQLAAPSNEKLRKACIESDLYLSAPTSKAAKDSNYLMGVCTQQYWVPFIKQVRMANCECPPSKALLLQMVREELNKPNVLYPNGRNLGITDPKMVDRKWLLDVLATLNQNHEIFQPGYKPPTAAEVEEEDVLEDNLRVPDPLGVLQKVLQKNPALLSDKKQVRGRKSRFMSKEQELQSKLDQIMRSGNKMNVKAQKIQEQLEEQQRA